MKKYFMAFAGMTCFCLNVSAQKLERSVVSSGGGDVRTSDIQIAWTVGEPFVHTVSCSNLAYTEGFQQPVFVNKPNNQKIEKAVVENFTIEIAPNPVQSVLRTTINSPLFSKVDLLLSTLDGKQLFKQVSVGTPTVQSIDMSTMLPGTYLLTVISGTTILRSFKIIKL